MATLALPWMLHPPAEFTGGAVAVGNFDGVHRGHRALAASVRRQADRVTGPAVLVTFDPPPIALLNPTALKPPLTTIADRAELLHAAGADHVVALQTDPGLLSLSPEAFFEDVILRLFRAKALVEGFNFRFGRGRAGDTATLRTMCEAHGIAFEEFAPFPSASELVSSSRVRNALEIGDVARARALLDRDYAISGIVESGAKRGRTIGFPTANLGKVETVVPADGVYAVRAILADGRSFRAAANVGPNPTFGDDSKKIEVHLLDFTGDLYGQRLRIEFAARIRDTKPFANATALVEQLKRDVDAVRRTIGENR